MTKITRLTNQKLGKEKQAKAPKVQQWFSAFAKLPAVNLILLGLLVVGGGTYLGIVNSTAADTFQMYELSSHIQTTQESNQKLELEMSEVLSLPHVNEMRQQYDLVTATDVHYLNDTPAVAFSN